MVRNAVFRPSNASQTTYPNNDKRSNENAVLRSLRCICATETTPSLQEIRNTKDIRMSFESYPSITSSLFTSEKFVQPIITVL